TNSQILVEGFRLVESWSGYALDRSTTGGAITPFIIPGVDSSGHTNLVSDGIGALRLWLTPYWSTTNGSVGPGAYARVAELLAVGDEALVNWSLQISPSGDALRLIAQSQSGPAQ